MPTNVVGTVGADGGLVGTEVGSVGIDVGPVGAEVGSGAPDVGSGSADVGPSYTYLYVLIPTYTYLYRHGSWLLCRFDGVDGLDGTELPFWR